ncbi:MAG: BlaI/MecI/CopY family transcriptional regulator [Chloroflexota bacterium]
MPDKPLHSHLSRRESQIMDVIYRLGEATAEQVREELTDNLSNSAIRSHLRILEKKEQLTHRRDGGQFVYIPTVAPEKARRSLLDHIVYTFFGGSTQDAIATLLDTENLTEDDLDQLSQLIDDARKGAED